MNMPSSKPVHCRSCWMFVCLVLCRLNKESLKVVCCVNYLPHVMFYMKAKKLHFSIIWQIQSSSTLHAPTWLVANWNQDSILLSVSHSSKIKSQINCSARLILLSTDSRTWGGPLALWLIHSCPSLIGDELAVALPGSSPIRPGQIRIHLQILVFWIDLIGCRLHLLIGP